MTFDQRAYDKTYYATHRKEKRVYQVVYRAAHPKETRAYSRAYAASHNEEERARKQTHHAKQKKALINRYGGRCACCGEDRIEFMTIDHIHGGGAKHRAEIGNVYSTILKEPYNPDKYQVLCHNCNMALGLYGYCPHRPEYRQKQGGIVHAAEHLPLFAAIEC